MAANTEVRNPNTGDVKRVPNELVKKYEDRGWEKTKPAKKTSSDTSSSK